MLRVDNTYLKGTSMTITQLIKHLIRIYLKYGNCEIDLLIEDEHTQWEAPLGELAFTSRGKRVKLLSKGFT